MEQTRTYLVTGGAGFIGSHLCDALLKQKAQVLCVDNLCDFYDPEIKLANLRSLLPQPGFHFLRADIRDVDAMNSIFREHNIHMVIHMAAMAGVRPSIENPALYFDVNVAGTEKLLELCRLHNLKHFIFASSSSIYGNNNVPFHEEDRVDHPISPYAASKKAGELMCYTWHHLFDLSTICLRFFTVYGPRQRPDLAIHKFARAILAEQPITMFGDGSTARDYTFVEDIVNGILGAIWRIENAPDKLYEIYNLGNSHPITLREMIHKLEIALGKPARIKRQAMQAGDVEITFADVSQAKRMLGYRPQTSFEDGLERFADWLKNS